MKILVIGGSGFIGSHIVDQLLGRGHEIRVFDRSEEQFRATPKGVELRVGQLDDAEALSSALVGVDSVIHTANTTVPSTSNLDPLADIQGNLINNVRLLQLMRDASVDHIVFLSSGGTVYGIPDTPLVREDHPLRPISSYGVVKVAFEKYLAVEQYLHGLKPLVLRPSNPYGSRQSLTGVQGVIGVFLRRAAQNQPLEIWGDGSIVRDFFHVSDLASLCAHCAEKGLTGTYNAGSGVGASINDIVEIVKEVTRRDLEVEYKTGRGFDVPKVVLDISAIQNQIDWVPRIDLKDGIAMTWDWMQAQSR